MDRLGLFKGCRSVEKKGMVAELPQEGLLELEGSVESVIYHNDINQYTVLEMNAGSELITVVGAFPYVSAGEQLHVIGRWSSHPNFGEQFKAEGFERSRPTDTGAILKYLSSGAVKGIGPATAAKITAQFGEKSLEVIENEPERLCVIKGITQSKAEAISGELKRIYGIRELMAYLAGYGVKPEDSVKVWRYYGSGALACISDDPYCLCGENIDISFDIADSIAKSLETPADSLVRVKAGVLHILRHNLNNGHTCLPADKLTAAGVSMLTVEKSVVEDGIYELCAEGGTVCCAIGEREYIFLSRQYEAEKQIAERMKIMLQYPPQSISGVEEEIAEIEKTEGTRYAPKQREAITAALSRGILVLTGGPGTGKTTTLNAIIRILKQKGERVLLAAPTGRAAKRMSELTGEEAKTIHRLLQVDWDENDEPVFTKNERDPLECDCLVIDELSMVDSYVFESVLKALPLASRLILVGDTDQLPSVGPGNVLGDVIASGKFPTVQLTEIFRQSMESLIVTNAHRIVEGRMPDLSRRDADFFFIPVADKAEGAELIVSLCAGRLPKSYGYSSVSDIQVLCPGRKGELGTTGLNAALREVVNPSGKNRAEIKINGVIFRQGDKVMQIKNDYELPWVMSDGRRGEGVFNGDIGVITEIDRTGGTIRVEIDEREVLYDFEHAYSELEPAYAVTIHKSQGNEFTAVIIPVFRTISQLCYRNLLYTGVTRAKKLLILVGERQTIQAMVENDRKTKRYTGLCAFLQE